MQRTASRVGVVVPSVNTVVEPFFSESLAPTSAVHAGRMYWDGPASIDSVEAMDEFGAEAAISVATARPQVIVYGCTATTLVKGRDYDLALMEDLISRTGVPVVTATEAILRAIEALRVSTISIASPYLEEIDAKETAFFRQCGIEVARVESLHIADAFAIAEVDANTIRQLGRRAMTDDSDALFVSCLNLRSHEAISALESDLGRPVITSTQASLWAALEYVTPTQLDDLGVLFEAARTRVAQ